MLNDAKLVNPLRPALRDHGKPAGAAAESGRERRMNIALNLFGGITLERFLF